MKVIGFTEVYYTLWEVGEVYQEQIYSMGMVVGSVSKQQVTYIKNLSMDFEKAKKKLAGEKFDIDLELRGHSSFTRVTGTEFIDWETHFPQDVFSFGKQQGVPFKESTDLWQLNRAMRGRFPLYILDRTVFVLEPHQMDGYLFDIAAVAAYPYGRAGREIRDVLPLRLEKRKGKIIQFYTIDDLAKCN